MLSIILPTFLTSLYVGINMGARLGGGNAVVLPQILYPTDVFDSVVTKGKGGCHQRRWVAHANTLVDFSPRVERHQCLAGCTAGAYQ